MKKKIFGAMVVVAIAVSAIMNVNLNKVSSKGHLAMASVEALAQNEGSGGGKFKAIYKTVSCPGTNGGMAIECWPLDNESCSPFNPCYY
jgi:hypothetical protein